MAGLFSRAFKKIVRKYTKTVLLIITFFLIGNFVVIGLGVSNASEAAKTLTRQKMRAIVEYKLDQDKLEDFFSGLSEEQKNEQIEAGFKASLNKDIIDLLLSDQLIKAYSMGFSALAYADEIKAVPLNNSYETSASNAICQTIDAENNLIQYQCQDAVFRIRLELSHNLIDFADEILTLVDGRMYDQKDIDSEAKVCLISDKLAEYNNLKIGDSFVFYRVAKTQMALQQNAWMQGNEEYIRRELEVIGIFNNSEVLDPNSPDYEYLFTHQSPDNLVIYPFNATRQSDFQASYDSYQYHRKMDPDNKYYDNPNRIPTLDGFVSITRADLLLYDPQDVDSIIEEYKVMEDRDYMVFNGNNSVFDMLSKPFNTITLFSNIIIWLVLINAIIIITLVIALTLKTREFEIGVFISMGISKTKIIAQFFVEISIIALVGLTLAIFSGSLVAKQVGNTVLYYQVIERQNSIQEPEPDYNYGFEEKSYFTELSFDDLVAQYEVNISLKIIVQLYLSLLGVVFISILIPALMIMRYKPKRILMNIE